MQALAAELRQRTGLTLFNYDLLRPAHVTPGVCAMVCIESAGCTWRSADMQLVQGGVGPTATFCSLT